MFYRNRKLLIAVLMLAFSFAGLLVMQNAHNSVPSNATTKTQSNTVLVNGNEAYKKGKFGKSDASSIEFENHLNRQTPEGILFRHLQRWVKEKPADLLSYILQMRDAQLQLKFLTYALDIWHSDDPSALRDWLLTVHANSAMTTLCGKEVFAPPLCVQYAEKISNLEKQNNIIDYQLRHWAVADADAAIAWVVKTNDRYKRFGVGVFRHVLEFDFDTALFSLSQLNDRDLSTSTEVADLIVKKLYQSQSRVESDASAVANAALSLSDSKFKDMLLLSLAPILFELGDTYNSMVLLEAMADGPARDSLQHNFVRRLTEQQGAEAALRYLEQLNNEVNKQELIGSVIIRWSREDIVAAHDWFKAWSSPLPETTLSLTQAAIDQQNISIARDLLDSLKNTSDTTFETAEYNFQLARLMYDDSPESAIKYLESNLELSLELSKEDKKALLAYLVNIKNSGSENEPNLSKQ